MLVRQGLVVAILLVVGAIGCLRSFGPNLRPRGVHGELPVASPNETCMGCHESEADALARMRAAGRHPALAPAPAPAPASMPELGPPLVADWMVEEPRACIDCHRIRQ
ncbi:MAG: hypothetical protein R6X02_18530 [Enhygromyxa sp.]